MMRWSKLILVIGLVLMAGSTLVFPPVFSTIEISSRSYQGILFKGTGTTSIHTEIIGLDIMEYSVFVLNKDDLITSIREGSLDNTTPIFRGNTSSTLSLLIEFPEPSLYGVLLMTDTNDTAEVRLSITSVIPQWPLLLPGMLLVAFVIAGMLFQKLIKSRK